MTVEAVIGLQAMVGLAFLAAVGSIFASNRRYYASLAARDRTRNPYARRDFRRLAREFAVLSRLLTIAALALLASAAMFWIARRP